MTNARVNTTCPVCGPQEFRHCFEKKGRDFWRCTRCGLEKIHPLPTREELSAYYDREYRDGMYHTFTSAKRMKQMTAQRRLKEIHPYALPGRWLDVGCSDGVFIAEASKSPDIDAQGVELSDVAVRLAQERGLTATCGTLDAVDARNFDCITAFDVLEHVIDPLEFLRDIKERLRDGGRTFISIPNAGSLIKRMMGSRWYFYIPEEHLHYFNRAVIRQLIARAELNMIACRMTFKPMTYNYALTQFAAYNPLIFQVLKFGTWFIPSSVREWILPLYIGEMMVVAEKTGSDN